MKRNQGRKINWTKTLDMFIGKVPDRTLAKFIGCTVASVYRRRLILGKSSFKYINKCAKKFKDRYGKTEEEMLEWLKMKHPHFKTTKYHSIDKESILRDLPYMSNNQIIDKHGVSESTVSRFRAEFGIRSPSNKTGINSKKGRERLTRDFIRMIKYTNWLVKHVDEDGKKNFRYKRLLEFIEQIKDAYKLGID